MQLVLLCNDNRFFCGMTELWSGCERSSSMPACCQLQSTNIAVSHSLMQRLFLCGHCCCLKLVAANNCAFYCCLCFSQYHTFGPSLYNTGFEEQKWISKRRSLAVQWWRLCRPQQFAQFGCSNNCCVQPRVLYTLQIADVFGKSTLADMKVTIPCSNMRCLRIDWEFRQLILVLVLAVVL